ncbi:MAG: AfsR/SARP family transcriptional regulator [Acidimicrobiales bacterium]
MLGPLSVTRNGKPVNLSRPPERRLLALLLITRSRTLLDDQILDALWPGQTPGNPGQALRTSVSRLRKKLRTQRETIRARRDTFRSPRTPRIRPPSEGNGRPRAEGERHAIH